jgi:hypothetical protein
MLADSVEASTRSLTEITPQWLETSIENMIKQRFVEGQLDYCDLTLRDLTRIKEAFLKILLGIHHQRIQYPDQLRTEREISEAASGEKGAVPEGLPGEVLPADQLSPDQLSSDQLAQEHQAGQHRREHLRRHPRRTGQERQAPAAPGLASAMPVPDEGIVSPDQDEPGGEDRDEPRSPESGSSPGHSMPDQSP